MIKGSDYNRQGTKVPRLAVRLVGVLLFKLSWLLLIRSSILSSFSFIRWFLSIASSIASLSVEPLSYMSYCGLFSYCLLMTYLVAG